MEKRLFGVVNATITPLKKDGTVDETSVADLVEYLIQSGINGVYPNGTNGESLVMSLEERNLVSRITVEANNHRIAAYIQCGSMTTKEAINHAEKAVEIGADGIGIMSPVFFPMDDTAMFCYYCDVIEAVPDDFPVYVYNIPGCTTSDVKVKLLSAIMARFPNVKGIKYSMPDIVRVQDYLDKPDRDTDVLLGCDRLFLPCLVSGGKGIVSGPASVFHERFTRLYRQYREGDLAGAEKTQRQIVKAERELAGIPGIPALKAMLKMRGVIKTDICRAPLRALERKEYEIIDKVLDMYYREESIS